MCPLSGFTRLAAWIDGACVVCVCLWLGGPTKARLSRAARRLLKKHKGDGSVGQVLDVQSTLGSGEEASAKGNKRDFREAGAYIDYGVTEYDKLVEDQLQPRVAIKDNEMHVANRCGTRGLHHTQEGILFRESAEGMGWGVGLEHSHGG